MNKFFPSVLLASSLTLSACGQNPYVLYQYIVTEYAGPVQVKDPIRPAQKYREAHNAAEVIIDLHADTLTSPDEGTPFERLLTNPDRDGQLDVPRMIQGNMALQVFGNPSKASMDLVAPELGLAGSCSYGPVPSECNRRYYERDPDGGRYDDPTAPYQLQYAPLGLPRDIGAYMARLAGAPCETWYGTTPWDPTLWGTTAACPGYVKEKEYILRLFAAADRLTGAIAADAQQRLRLIRSRSDLQALLLARKQDKSRVGAMLATEGLYFPSDVATPAGRSKVDDDFRLLFNKGYRMFAMTHFIDSDHGGSNTGMAMANNPGYQAGGRGLSAEGRRFSQLALQHGALLDVAHASPRTLSDMVALAATSRKPIVYSHGGVAEAFDDPVCSNSRNLSDAQVREIASTGGVVGIGFAESFNCDISPAAFAQAVRHAVDAIDAQPMRRFHDASGPILKGVDHVAMGSDFDGLVKTYVDAANLDQYTRALMCKRELLSNWSCLERPFEVHEVHKILGGNALRVLLEALPATTQTL